MKVWFYLSNTIGVAATLVVAIWNVTTARVAATPINANNENAFEQNKFLRTLLTTNKEFYGLETNLKLIK